MKTLHPSRNVFSLNAGAVLLALVSFLGTAAFAFLFDDAHSQMPEKSEERP